MAIEVYDRNGSIYWVESSERWEDDSVVNGMMSLGPELRVATYLTYGLHLTSSPGIKK
jgi:hypothetical protein